MLVVKCVYVVFRLENVKKHLKHCLLAFSTWVFLFSATGQIFGQANPSAAAISSQTQQDQQLRTQLKQTEETAQPKEDPQARLLLAKPLSPDMGEVKILGDEPTQPWFFVAVDTQAFYNSNVLYAASIDNTFGAWQIITTPEIGFAPTIQDETYQMLSPRAGFRYQFFTYAQAEPPKSVYATTGPSALNFDVMNPYASLDWRVDDDLSFNFSVQASIYEGSGRDRSAYTNFLDEYPLAWQANWSHVIEEIHSLSLTARASYVWANPSNFSRTDNNLTVSWGIVPNRELSLQFYATARLAKYTGIQEPGQFDNYDRLDIQQTYGASVTWTPVEYVSLRGFISWTKSDSTQVQETGTFEALNAGTGLNLIYRF